MFSEKAGNAGPAKRKSRGKRKQLRRSNQYLHTSPRSPGDFKRASSPGGNPPGSKHKTVLKLDLKAKLLEVRRRGQSRGKIKQKRGQSKEVTAWRDKLRGGEKKGLKCFVKRRESNEKVVVRDEGVCQGREATHMMRLSKGKLNGKGKSIGDQNRLRHKGHINDSTRKPKLDQGNLGRRSRILKNSQKNNISKVKSGKKQLQSPVSDQHSKTGRSKLKGLKKTAKKRKTSRQQSRGKSKESRKWKSKVKLQKEDHTQNLLLGRNIDTVIEAFNERSRQIDHKISLRIQVQNQNKVCQDSGRKTQTKGTIGSGKSIEHAKSYFMKNEQEVGKIIKKKKKGGELRNILSNSKKRIRNSSKKKKRGKNQSKSIIKTPETQVTAIKPTKKDYFRTEKNTKKRKTKREKNTCRAQSPKTRSISRTKCKKLKPSDKKSNHKPTTICRDSSFFRRKQEHSASHGITHRKPKRDIQQKSSNFGFSLARQNQNLNKKIFTNSPKIGFKKNRKDNSSFKKRANKKHQYSNKKQGILNTGKAKISQQKVRKKSLQRKYPKRIQMTPKNKSICREGPSGRNRLKRIQRSLGSDAHKASHDKLSGRCFKKKKERRYTGNQLISNSGQTSRNESGSLRRRNGDQSWSYKAGSSASSGGIRRVSDMQESLGSEYMLRRAADRVDRKISPESFQFSEKSSQNLCSLQNELSAGQPKFRRLRDERTLKESTKNLQNTLVSKQSQFVHIGESRVTENLGTEASDNSKVDHKNLKQILKKRSSCDSKKNLKNRKSKVNLRISENGYLSKIKREILSQSKYRAGTPKSRRVPLSSQRDKNYYRMSNATSGSKLNEIVGQKSQKNSNKTGKHYKTRGAKGNTLSHRARLLEGDLRGSGYQKLRQRSRGLQERLQSSESQHSGYRGLHNRSYRKKSGVSFAKKSNTRANRKFGEEPSQNFFKAFKRNVKPGFDLRGYSHALGAGHQYQNSICATPSNHNNKLDRKAQRSRGLGSRKGVMTGRGKMVTSSVNNYHHQSSHYQKQKFKRKVNMMRKSRDSGDLRQEGRAEQERFHRKGEISHFDPEKSKENRANGGNQSDREHINFRVKEFESLGTRVELFVRALRTELGGHPKRTEWKTYLQKFENFTETLIDWSAESENLIRSKQKVLERKLIRKCNSISNTDGQTPNLIEDPAKVILNTQDRDSLRLEEIQLKIKHIGYLAAELAPLFGRSQRVIQLLLGDMERLVIDKVIQTENLGLVMWNLIKIAAEQELAGLENRIRHVMKTSFLKHLLNDSELIFETMTFNGTGGDRELGVETVGSRNESLKQGRESLVCEQQLEGLEGSENTVVASRQKVTTSKTQKKLPKSTACPQENVRTKNQPSLTCISPTNPNSKMELQSMSNQKETASDSPHQIDPSFQSKLSKQKGTIVCHPQKIPNPRSKVLNPEDILELGGLKELLHKSKKDFHKFLKSFGWTDHQIEDVMRTISLRESVKVRGQSGSLPRTVEVGLEEKYQEGRLEFTKRNNANLRNSRGRFAENKRKQINLKNQIAVKKQASRVQNQARTSKTQTEGKTWALGYADRQDVENQIVGNYKSKSLNQGKQQPKLRKVSHKNHLYNRGSPEISVLSNKTPHSKDQVARENLTKNQDQASPKFYKKNYPKKEQIGKNFQNIMDQAPHDFDETNESRFRKKSRLDDVSESGNLSKTACKLIRNQLNTRDVQIQEYISEEDKGAKSPFPNADFHSQKTNCVNFSADSLHLPGPDTSSIRPSDESKLDLKKMSVSNNLSQIFRERRSEVNIYAELSSQQREISRLSHKSVNSVRNEIIPLVPLSDPEFSSKKIKKNRKMRDFLERASQNLSNKSIMSLTDNRELFSRKSSSLQDLMIERRNKTSKQSNLILPNPLKLRVLKKKSFSPPKSYQFADVLEEKHVLNLDLLEYPDLSGNRMASFHSSKQSREGLIHRQKLLNTKMVSFTSRARGSNRSNGTRSPSGSPGRIYTQPSRSEHDIVQQIQRVSAGTKMMHQQSNRVGRRTSDGFGKVNDIRIPAFDQKMLGSDSNLDEKMREITRGPGSAVDKENAQYGSTVGQYYSHKGVRAPHIERKLSAPCNQDKLHRHDIIKPQKFALTNTKTAKQNTKFEYFEEICKEIELKLFQDILEEKRYLNKQKNLENSLIKKKKQKLKIKFKSLSQNFDRKTQEFLKNNRFGVRFYPNQIEAFFNGFTEFLCARRLDEVVLNINKEYGPKENQILEECRNPEGVDVSTFRECKTQPVLSEDSFFEFFYFRHSLHLLGDHPVREIRLPKTHSQNQVSSPQIGKTAPRPKRLQALPSIENFESNQRSEVNSDLIVSLENVQTVEKFCKFFPNEISGDHPKCKENWELVLEWLGFKNDALNNHNHLDQPSTSNFWRNLPTLRCPVDSYIEPARYQLENLYYTFQAEKMLFDSLNEALCSWRPFATKGRPLPGLSHFGRLNKVRIQPEEIPYIFSVTVSKQMESAGLLCGVLGERETLLHQRWNFDSLNPLERRLLECLLASDEGSAGNLLPATELLNKLREEKLVKFLNWGIFETDEKWLFYDYETLETQLKLTDLVLNALFDDLVVDFLN